jgi:pSer/pThr/pTyr-binding forkhead associated (FHA) protein
MTAWLSALTPSARLALLGQQHVIERFPFRVGLESRLGGTVRTNATERRGGTGAQQVNDLYVFDSGGEVVQVSREHFQIEQQGSEYVLVDRASACGTIVEGQRVGGDRAGGSVVLHDHDVIIVGDEDSPFVFKFRVG